MDRRHFGTFFVILINDWRSIFSVPISCSVSWFISVSMNYAQHACELIEFFKVDKLFDRTSQKKREPIAILKRVYWFLWRFIPISLKPKSHILGSKYRKSEAFFFRTNQQIEQLCKMVSTVAVEIILQLVMLPKFVISFATYFFTDSGRDSFELPYPLWWVLSSLKH